MTDPMELVGRLEAEAESSNYQEEVLGERLNGVGALLTEAAACIREMVEWRPIETAPHETLVVLGWFEDGVWKQDLGLASAGQRWPTGASNMWWHGSATHWLPLPPAPGAEDE